MGIWDSIKKGAKNLADDMAKREEIKRKKRKILEKFSMPQLKKLALDYGVNVRLPPDLNEVIGGGDFYNPYESKTTSRPKKRAKPKLTRGDYINSLMRVPFDYLTDFCDKNRIYVDNIVIDNKSGVAKIKNYPNIIKFQ